MFKRTVHLQEVPLNMEDFHKKLKVIIAIPIIMLGIMCFVFLFKHLST
jgi:hypothetical protein